ncbi:MAG TPA: hypothetical protein VM364_15395 [Vicinamibacterales bacterium]|nr:hypothetical protein [Vicinamibacterales bacterium]
MAPTSSHDHDRHHAEHGHAAHDGLYNEDVAHEHSDVNVRALLLFCAGLAALVAVVFVAMWGLFVVFERQAAGNDPVLTPHALPAGQLPPEPRLLTDEPLNLQRIRAEEDAVLKGQPAGEGAGAARLPIDEAKRRLLEQGLPVRADAPADPWIGTWNAAYGEASSGRAIQIRPGVLGPDQPATPAAGQPPGQPVPPKEPGKGGH